MSETSNLMTMITRLSSRLVYYPLGIFGGGKRNVQSFSRLSSVDGRETRLQVICFLSPMSYKQIGCLVSSNTDRSSPFHSIDFDERRRQRAVPLFLLFVSFSHIEQTQVRNVAFSPITQTLFRFLEHRKVTEEMVRKVLCCPFLPFIEPFQQIRHSESLKSQSSSFRMSRNGCLVNSIHDIFPIVLLTDHYVSTHIGMSIWLEWVASVRLCLCPVRSLDDIRFPQVRHKIYELIACMNSWTTTHRLWEDKMCLDWWHVICSPTHIPYFCR